MKCRKNTENLNSKIFITKNGKLIMQSKFPDCEIKKSICERTTSKRLLSNLAIKTLLSFILRRIKMSETVNKFLLAGDKFMPEMH